MRNGNPEAVGPRKLNPAMRERSFTAKTQYWMSLATDMYSRDGLA
jgi:hypothetical protein